MEYFVLGVDFNHLTLFSQYTFMNSIIDGTDDSVTGTPNSCGTSGVTMHVTFSDTTCMVPKFAYLL